MSTDYIEALRREHAGYIQYGRTDAAAEVAAELARLGHPVTGRTPKTAPRRSRKEHARGNA